MRAQQAPWLVCNMEPPSAAHVWCHRKARGLHDNRDAVLARSRCPHTRLVQLPSAQALHSLGLVSLCHTQVSDAWRLILKCI